MQVDAEVEKWGRLAFETYARLTTLVLAEDSSRWESLPEKERHAWHGVAEEIAKAFIGEIEGVVSETKAEAESLEASLREDSP